MELYEKLFLLRKEKNITQQELAEILNVSRQAVSRWEMNVSVPSMENLILLSKFYETNIDYLVNDNLENEVNIKKETDNNQKLYSEKKQEKKSRQKIIFIGIFLIISVVILFLGTFLNSSVSSAFFLLDVVLAIFVIFIFRFLWLRFFKRN